MTGLMAMTIGMMLFAAGMAGGTPPVDAGEGDGKTAPLLEGTFDFSRPRISEKRYYDVRSEVAVFSASGERSPGDGCRMLLIAEPPVAGLGADAIYRCVSFTLSRPDGGETDVPRLEQYTHPFLLNESGIDGRGYLYDVDHSLFSILTDGGGKPLTTRQAALAYGTFIDFHRYCDYYARPTFSGKGIQDLHRVGDRVVHAAAYRFPPVAERSGTDGRAFTFRNGEVTLEFLGLSVRGDEPCALMRLDSGECRFSSTNDRGERVVAGGSRYRADLHIELESGWVAGATVVERMFRSSAAGDEGERSAMEEKTFTVRSLSEEEFAEILGPGGK